MIHQTQKLYIYEEFPRRRQRLVNIYNFYDTCSLLLRVDDLFTVEENIIISSVTLNELENIRTSAHKDESIKQTARELLRLLAHNKNKYTVWVFQEDMLMPFKKKGLTITPDIQILACAFDYDHRVHPDETVFFTNDLALQNIANLFFGKDSIKEVQTADKEDYSGYKDIIMSEEEMAYFYEHPYENVYGLEINEYLIIRNLENEIVSQLCWTGDGYRHITYTNLDSNFFGRIKAMNGDPYQVLAIDSLVNNKITMLKGKSGSGKSFLALGYLFHELEKGHINKVIVFCNTVAAKNAAKLGFYPGDKEDKLLDSQIGNMLSSKFGSKFAVEELIDSEKIILMPLSDIRGYDTSGMKAGVYISEAQNLDIYLMKLALQRIGEDSICIIDGDYNTQVDDENFAGAHNGMRRVSQIFRGQDIYGEVELKKIHRSRLAEIADQL